MVVGPVGARRHITYRAQRMPTKAGLAHLGEWIRLWRFRFGIETGIDELEPAERMVCCTLGPRRLSNGTRTLSVDAIFVMVLALLAYNAYSWLA